MYEHHPIKRVRNVAFEPIWVETQVWLLNTKATIDRLLFDSNYVMPAAPTKPLEAANKRTIMVVDDNESLRRFTAMLLEKQGFDVVQKEDGQQALDALDSDEIDLILMDIEMPIMDGVELLAEFEELIKRTLRCQSLLTQVTVRQSLWRKWNRQACQTLLSNRQIRTDCSIRLLTGFSECHRLKRTAILSANTNTRKSSANCWALFV